ncbi:MAG: MerR family transcriptional regulator, partial [Anaerolineales bacterium]|nr:MerR family transcriptional regulator [Anaerolineales bacterium]
IRIGDFSKLSRVSVKTLRFYDEMGLLKPVEVDRFTGYRYYEFDQLPRLYRILALKDLGFSLEAIGHLLEGDLSTEQMRGMLKLRQAEIRQRVEEEAERLGRVELWLRQIEQEDSMSKYDVVIKKVEPVKVASVRGVIPKPNEQRPLWSELWSYLKPQHVQPSGPCFTLYHDTEYRERDWDVEVCEQINVELAPTQRVNVYSLPSVETMACTVHAGPFVTIGEAYDAILKWMDENKYQIVGPSREIVLREPQPNNSQNDAGTVTEIQYPVEKAG